MKIYGETIFDIAYLIIGIVIGIQVMHNKKNKLNKMMGLSIITLVCGDAFHLIPRVLDYFINYDFTMYLGIGKLITSITMTIFYVLMYYIYLKNYDVKKDKIIEYFIWILGILRIILCLMPQNNWLTNNGSVTIGIIRNIPFVILGALIIYLYFKRRKADVSFKNIWIYILLSFLFYIPVVILASTYPLVGMLMLPKTICYLLIIFTFNRKSKSN